MGSDSRAIRLSRKTVSLDVSRKCRDRAMARLRRHGTLVNFSKVGGARSVSPPDPARDPPRSVDRRGPPPSPTQLSLRVAEVRRVKGKIQKASRRAETS